MQSWSFVGYAVPKLELGNEELWHCSGMLTCSHDSSSVAKSLKTEHLDTKRRVTVKGISFSAAEPSPESEGDDFESSKDIVFFLLTYFSRIWYNYNTV